MTILSRTMSLLFRTAVIGALLCLTAQAAPDLKKNFNLPAGEAASTLKQFSEASGRETLFAAETVRGVKTNAVKGEFTATEALERMLDQTGLAVVQDEKTGALAIKRDSSPNAPRAAQTSSDRPEQNLKIESGKLVLETVQVLGSRISRSEVDGPSPVSIYRAEEIRATGAMSLADFLRTIPQTYSGVGAGRNSTPDDLNMTAGQRNENLVALQPLPGGSPTLSTNAPVQTGVSGVSLRGLGSGSTLVLIDGRRVAQAGERNRGSATGQGFVDLNTIPLGLIERIEIITDGASAIYGADAVAGVINIVLKKSWVGSEVSTAFKVTQHGGGNERQFTAITGFSARGGRLRGTVALDYYERDPLHASQRSFSETMDYRTQLQGYSATTGAAVYGTDQRVQWGYPASVQSTATTGFVSIPGIRVLLAPAGSTTTPAIAAFERRTTNDPGQTTATAIVAQGQRITNPAEWLELVSGANRRGVTGTANYGFRNGIEAYGTYSYTDSRGEARSLPVYVSNITVAATNNIFGEAIQFGMLLPEWGQIAQKTRTQTHTLTAGLRGNFGATWHWDTGYRSQDQKYHSLVRSFNATAFNALANNNDPALRFNPFLDGSMGGAASQVTLLEQTAIYPTVDGRSGLDSFDATLTGDLFNIWGGPVRMALGGSHERTTNVNSAVTYSGFPVVATTTTYRNTRTTEAAFSELQVPIFGKTNKRPLLQRLELNLAGRYEKASDQDNSSTVPKYGVTWSPFRAILIRGSHSEGYRAPSLTENRRPTTSTTTSVSDPARGNVLTQYTSVARPNPDLAPETSTNEFLGVVFEPPFAKGLLLQVNYYRTIQKNAIQSLATSTILNNPALFPGFIIRADPTPADIAAGYPGAITTIYTQYANFGEVRNESVDFGADYRLPWEKIGRWRLTVNAAKTLKQTRQLTVGSVPIDDIGDTYSSPRWNVSSTLYWNKGAWTASSSFSYMSGFATNKASAAPTLYALPPVHLIDLRGTYEFKQGVWRNHGKGLRVGLGIANLADAKPPFLNNIYGFNAGLHGRYVFGRTFEFSLLQPF